MKQNIVLIALISVLITGTRAGGVRRQDDNNGTFRLASYYGDHMVLQKAPHQAVVWGYGDKIGSNVTVTLNGFTAVTAVVNGNKTWNVKLPAVSDTKNHTLTVKSDNAMVTLSDILFGDVWLCSGESNMKFTLDMGNNATAEMQDAKNFPHIRLFSAAEESSDTEQMDLKGVDEYWSLPNQDTVGHQKWTYFSALCWLYGKRLYKERGYPIGLISSTHAMSGIEAWSSPDVLDSCGIKTEDFGINIPSSSVWNAMILPFTRMTIYGVIWYQGESDVVDPHKYNCTFPAMIVDWRKHFNLNSNGETDKVFPFGFVQLAANGTGNSSSGFPDVRWHQTADFGYVPNSAMEKVFMAVALDLPDDSSPFGSIHPRDKQDVANRLLLSGLVVAYNKKTSIRTQGPIPNAYSMDMGQRTIRIEYDDRTTLLSVRSMDGFEVCCSPNNNSMCNDKSSRWMPAPIIEYDAYSIKVWYEACSTDDHVVGLRYEWKETPCTFARCAVYSKNNYLPASPMITIGSFGNPKYDRARTKRKVIY